MPKTARSKLKRIKGELPYPAKPEAEIKRPEVIVDIELNDGLFFMVIKNIGEKSALKVKLKLDKRIVGLGGSKELNRMNIFNRFYDGIEFLPPGKEIRFLLDSASSYFAREEPTRFTITVFYHNSSGKRYREEIKHNLDIYRDIPFVINKNPLTALQGSENRSRVPK